MFSKKAHSKQIFPEKIKLQSQLYRVKTTKSHIIYKSKNINVYGNRVMTKLLH